MLSSEDHIFKNTGGYRSMIPKTSYMLLSSMFFQMIRFLPWDVLCTSPLLRWLRTMHH